MEERRFGEFKFKFTLAFQSDNGDIFIVEDDDRRKTGHDGSGAASATHTGIALLIALILTVGT